MKFSLLDPDRIHWWRVHRRDGGTRWAAAPPPQRRGHVLGRLGASASAPCAREAGLRASTAPPTAAATISAFCASWPLPYLDMGPLTAFSLAQWITSHRAELRPPVCNKQVCNNGEFIVMVVGGPNARKDYRDDPARNFSGGRHAPAHDGGRRRRSSRSAKVKSSCPPPCPALAATGTRTRLASSSNASVAGRGRHLLSGIATDCDAPLYSEYLQVTSLETQLPPIFERFWANAAHRALPRVRPRAPVTPT